MSQLFLILGFLSVICLLVSIQKELRIKSKETEQVCHIDTENLVNLLENKRIQREHDIQPRAINIATPPHGKSLQSSLFAIVGGGGLGNVLFELISFRGIASYLNRTPQFNVIEDKLLLVLYNKIQPLFPDLIEGFEFKMVNDTLLKRQQLNFGKCCTFDDPFKLLNSTDQHLFIDGHYFQSFKYFQHIRNDIRLWLTPQRVEFERAETMIPVSMRNNFIICAHVRRGDFTNDGVHQPSDPVFSRNGVDYLVNEYRKTHENLTVVVIGNDPNWAHTVFGDRVTNKTFVPPSNMSILPTPDSPKYEAIITPMLTPVVDIAFSRMYCDVFLITSSSSTFGWWLAYLTKESSVVYYRDIIESKDGVAREMVATDYYPPEWIRLTTNQNGTIQRN